MSEVEPDTSAVPSPTTSEAASVADAVIRRLVDTGITRAFGIPGVHNLALWEAAERHGGFQIVGVRHEQTAVYAADGAARVDRRCGVALTTTGPGAANTLGAFGEAAASGSPVVLIASEVPGRARSAKSSFARVHGSPAQSEMFGPLAKGTFLARSPEEAADAVAAAVALATAAPQGTAYVDIPADVLSAPLPTPGPTAPRVPTEPERPTDRDLDALVRLIGDSSRPLLWAGGGAATSDGAIAAVAALAERIGAPVLTSFAGRGVLVDDDPGWTGLPCHEPEMLDLIAEADVLVGLGTAFDGMNTRNWDLPLPRRLAVVNLRPTHLRDEGIQHLHVGGDVTEVTTRLLEQLDKASRAPWADLDDLRDRAWKRLRTHEMDPEAVELLAAVDTVLGRGDVVLADMAVGAYWVAGYARPRRPRQLQYPVGWGTLGYAVPASVGAGIMAAEGGARCTVVCGDGGLMFGLAELGTLRQEGLPVTVVVVDDGGYGMLRFDQDVHGYAHAGVDLTPPDLVSLAKSFGIPAESVDLAEPGRLSEALLDDPATGPRLVVVPARLRPPRTTSPRWRESPSPERLEL